MPEVEFAERNGLLRRTQARTFQPNDQFYRFQWNMEQIGAERTGGIQQGRRTVGVAVLDTGIAYETYFDALTRRQYMKAPDWGDTPFLPGFDFVGNDTHPNDDEEHWDARGGHDRGGDQQQPGVVGPRLLRAGLMPVKVLDEAGVGSFLDVAEGIDFATNFTQGETRIRVINLSLGGAGASATVAQAIDRAVAAGIVVVASAGNEGQGRDRFPRPPTPR